MVMNGFGGCGVVAGGYVRLWGGYEWLGLVMSGLELIH